MKLLILTVLLYVDPKLKLVISFEIPVMNQLIDMKIK